MSLKLSSGAPLRGAKRWAFIEKSQMIRVATVAGEGEIYLSPLYYVVKDDTIYIPIDQAVKHEKNVAAGGKFSAVIDEAMGFPYSVGVMIEGTIELVEDPELEDELLDLVLEKYFHFGAPDAELYINFGDYQKRHWIRVLPTRMIGFDSRELAQAAMFERRRLPEHVISKKGS